MLYWLQAKFYTFRNGPAVHLEFGSKENAKVYADGLKHQCKLDVMDEKLNEACWRRNTNYIF